MRLRIGSCRSKIFAGATGTVSTADTARLGSSHTLTPNPCSFVAAAGRFLDAPHLPTDMYVYY